MAEAIAPVGLPPWLDVQWRALRGARTTGHLPHALLVTGSPGVGKHLLADALARALLCASPALDGGACGACQDCALLARDSHPDLVRLGPDPEGKSDEIRVGAIRDMIEAEGLTSARGRAKVIVIDAADRMNLSAANALLKTLEEPVPGTLFCLLSERPHLLPATVRSRCQRLVIQLPSQGQALDWLRPQVRGYDPELLLRLAQGAPMRALALADQAMLARREAVLAGFIAVGEGGRDPLAEVQAWGEVGLLTLLEWLGGWLSDLLRLRADAQAAYMSNPDKRAVLRDAAGRLDAVVGHRYLQRVLGLRASQDTPLNAQLVCEALLIEWAGKVRQRG